MDLRGRGLIFKRDIMLHLYWILQGTMWKRYIGLFELCVSVTLYLKLSTVIFLHLVFIFIPFSELDEILYKKLEYPRNQSLHRVLFLTRHEFVGDGCCWCLGTSTGLAAVVEFHHA